MNDEQLTELQLQAEIMPQAARWPAPAVDVSIMGDTPSMRGLVWAKLHAVPREARERVAQAWAGMDSIDADVDLSVEGKIRRKKQYAIEVLADFEKSKALVDAKDAVDRQLLKWEKQSGLAVRPPTNIAEAVVLSEIRAHLAAMKSNRFSFVEKHVADERVVSAILGGPSFLSGQTDAEVALIKKRIEQHVSPDVAKARDETLKALEHAEEGWRKAKNKIGERGGLAKGPDGTWSESDAKNAAA
jgi:hypothetical protein